jgi:outer membrane protein/protease secretion system outer membrane protein
LALCASSAALAQTADPKPLSLSRALEIALSRAPDVAAARAAAAEASASAQAEDASFAPQAFATTTPGYSSGLPVAVAGRVPAVFGVELRKTLYDPARRADVLEAQARAAAAQGAFARSASQTASALVAAYGRNWADRELLEDARKTLESREAVLRRVSALAREGRRTELQEQQAGLEVARAKQALADRQSEFELDQLELAHFVDASSGQSVVIGEDPLLALPEPALIDNLAAARAADPELAALARQAERLERASALQKRAWLPVIQAEGQYLRLANYNNFDQYFVKFKANDWAVGVSVAIPIWTGGRLDHGKAAAAARLEKARADERRRASELELDVRRAEIDARRARAQQELATRALFVAREASRVAGALAGEGREDPDELDRREIAAAQAQDVVVRARQGVLAARVKLLALTGRLPGELLPGTDRSLAAAASVSSE